MYRNQLNINAAVFNSEISNTSNAFKEFFSVLFISWQSYDVENIVIKLLNAIDTFNEAEKVFKELFFNIYQLASQLHSKLNCNNIVLTINALDMFLPEILIRKLNKTTNEFLLDYDKIKKHSFQECFSKIRILIDLFRETNSIISTNILTEIDNVLKVLIKLCETKYFQLFIYEFALFLWNLFYEFYDFLEIRPTILDCFSKIFPKLVLFLLRNIDEKDYMEERQFVLKTFQTWKHDLIYGKFSKYETAFILSIIDDHDRFIGKYVDGIPENFYEDGYVICISATRKFETDEFYEDYENFLCTKDNWF